MYRWHFVIEGLPPGVLMTNPQQILVGNCKGMHAVEEARLGLHLNDAKQIYAPIEWIRNMVLFGAKGRKWGKRSVADELSAGLLINLDTKHVGFPFLRNGVPMTDNYPAPTGEPVDPDNPPDWEVFTAFARIPPRTGAMVPKSRPRLYAPWTLECHFDIFEGAEQLFSFIRKGQVEQLAAELGDKVVGPAGTTGGLGSWSPRKRGWHGRFKLLKSWIEQVVGDQPVKETEVVQKKAEAKTRKRKAG